MKELEMRAPAGHSIEYYRNLRHRECDEQRNQAILENEFRIHPIRADYASVPIQEAFDWIYVHGKVADEYELPDELPVFIFGFYSEPKPGVDRELLNDADLDAFIEARQTKPDDFLYYFRGEPDSNGRVMSYCIWTTPEAAQSVIHGEAHRTAAKLAKPSYKTAYTRGYMAGKSDDGGEIVFYELPEFGHTLSVGD